VYLFDFGLVAPDGVFDVAAVSVLAAFAEVHELGGDRVDVRHQSADHLLDHLDDLDEVFAFFDCFFEHLKVLFLYIVFLIVLEYLLISKYLDHQRPQRLLYLLHVVVVAVLARHIVSLLIS